MTSDGERYSISHEGGATNGSEQFADRPAVVVSNDENNKHSGVIEVVYMTTQPKNRPPDTCDYPQHRKNIHSFVRTGVVGIDRACE